MFDLTYFETHADELDSSKTPADKVMADAYATRPVGGLTEDYVSYLGTYYFLQDPDDMVISANKDYIALSNQEGSIHSLRFVWAGLLRNAAKIVITITDDTTGEVVFETVDTDVRKSYGDGGSIYPANVEIEFDTMDYNLANNSAYTVKLEGYLDYGDGGLQTNKSNTFEFPLVVDFQAPTVTGVTYTYEYDDTLKKNRLYANVEIYDNHHAMAAQLGHITLGTDENGNEIQELVPFEQYMTPIYSQRNSTTVVQIELTDYIYDLKENVVSKNNFVLTCYDYALNYATFEIGLPANYIDFYFDSLDEGLTLSVNEVFTLTPLVYPFEEWAELLEFSSSDTSVCRIVNNKLVAVSRGMATIKAYDPKTEKSVMFNVTVLGEGDEGYQYFEKPVIDVFRLEGYTTLKAYYMVNSEDKKLGNTGDLRFFEGDFNLSMYPSESVRLNTTDITKKAYFPKDTSLAFESSDEGIVTVDASGAITAVAEGFASVTVRVMMDGKGTYYSESVSIEVKDPFVSNAGKLTHYYGRGGMVTIPADLSLNAIGSFAFSNFDYVAKTPEELEIDDRETSKQWYLGENTITKVVIPDGVKIIEAYAFANLTALEEIVLPPTLESIEYGAFVGCTSLKKITFSGANNLKIINQGAFKDCALEGKLDLSSACVISDYAFAGNRKLQSVVTSEKLLSIGQYAFAGCEKLKDVTIKAASVKYGAYAFNGCKALTSFYVNAAVLPEGMFYECENLTSVKIGPDVKSIGAFAFLNTAVNTYEVASGNKAFKVQKAAFVLSADGKTLAAAAATASGAYGESICGKVTAVGNGAFSHTTKVTSINLPGVTYVGEYAFAYGTADTKGDFSRLAEVSLGKLTKIGKYAFFGTSITKTPELTKDMQVGIYAFAFTKLTEVTVPDGMNVAEGVFSQIRVLETVTIGKNVTLDKFAFNMDKDRSFDVEKFEQDGKNYHRYSFSSSLKNLTIGENANIGENAFAGHASITTVNLGQGATIGKMAFYNCTALASIDLSKAASIGDYAFSGDVYYVCMDPDMTEAAVSKEGTYMYTYHAPALTEINLNAATSIGENAFAYCRSLVTVTLNEKITTIPKYAFAGCIVLNSIHFNSVATIGDYAFMECAALTEVDLSNTSNIGEYAFVNCDNLQKLTLNPKGSIMGEGAFCYCAKLTDVVNMGFATDLGDYAFAHSGVTTADLSSAVNVGNHAFLKDTLTPFKVTLGNKLATLGDNPFALCDIEPFHQRIVTVFNGKEYYEYNYTYDISATVKVVDGALYCKVPNGWELTTYSDIPDAKRVDIIKDTVRVSAMAFAGTGVKMVSTPATTFSIGHKAFYLCDQLHIVILGAYDAPILEEEYDPSYYESYENLPGAGLLGTYTDWDGNEVQVEGMGTIPFYTPLAMQGMYSNVFYGANFVDYVGRLEEAEKLILVRPVNGKNYDSFIYGQYFDMDLVIDGAQAPDKFTLKVIAAIDAIPENVTYEQRHLVEYARSLYDQIATLEQQALVYNYDKLLAAEARIRALTPQPPAAPAKTLTIWQILIIIGLALVGLALLFFIYSLIYCAIKSKKEKRAFKEVFKEFWKQVKTNLGKMLKAIGRFFAKIFKKRSKKKAAEETAEVVQNSLYSEEDADASCEQAAPDLVEEETSEPEEKTETAEESVQPEAEEEVKVNAETETKEEQIQEEVAQTEKEEQ